MGCRRPDMSSVGRAAYAAASSVRLFPSVGTSGNRSAGVVLRSAAPGMPCRISRNAARRPFWDAILALLQAQGPLLALADLRADAAAKRGFGIFASSTGRSSGVARRAPRATVSTS